MTSTGIGILFLPGTVNVECQLDRILSCQGDRSRGVSVRISILDELRDMHFTVAASRGWDAGPSNKEMS